VKSGWKPGGPPSKAKYYMATDSELSTVRERRKEPRKGSEIVPETNSLQAVGVRPLNHLRSAYMYFVYVLRSLNEEKKFYIGITSDIEKRLEEHNTGMNTSTKHCKWELVYYEAYINKRYALKRERSLKDNRRMNSFLIKRINASLK
jgi:putative endonuclease